VLVTAAFNPPAVRAAMARLGLSEDDLARRLALSPRYLRAVITGRVPSARTERRIMLALVELERERGRARAIEP
jgi:hypothetical protein